MMDRMKDIIDTSLHFTLFIYKLNSLLTCFQQGFIAQLVEHRTSIAEVMGSNPIEASIISCAFFGTAKNTFTSRNITAGTRPLSIKDMNFLGRSGSTLPQITNLKYDFLQLGDQIHTFFSLQVHWQNVIGILQFQNL